MTASDIEDYVRWYTVEQDWKSWDAPWAKEDTDEAAQRREWTEYYEKVRGRSDDVFRWRLEIEWQGRHIGWCSSYLIDENYSWVSKARDGQAVYRAVGIDICEPDVQGKGIGTRALLALLGHHMIRCAEKLGFAECDRKAGIREVNGQSYDGLTFRKEIPGGSPLQDK